MSDTIRRLLVTWSFFIFVAFWWVSDVYGSDSHQTSNEASAHCAEDSANSAAAYNAYRASIGNTSEGGEAADCLHNEGLKYFECKVHRVLENGTILWTENCGQQSASAIGLHYYTEISPACEAEPGDQLTSYDSAVLPNFLQPGSLCQESCDYTFVSTDANNCTFSDSNGNGVPDDGETYSCPSTYEASGADCNSGNQANTSPNPTHYDCTNVQCGSDTDPGGGSGTDDPGSSLPGDDGPHDGGNYGGGDGDPDTPGTGDGTGSGDVDGDGDRDIDCDPNSNPDCAWSGSGQGSGDCATQPSCSGDPVQCAILYQEWASMCYDGTSITNPSDCRADLQCDGDKLQCEIIKQQRQQYCDLYVGDGTYDLDISNDADFSRDLKEEAEEIDLPTMVDTSGFGSGSCPAPFQFSALGQSFAISVEAFCQFAPYVRVLVILSALISAAFIVTGTRQ